MLITYQMESLEELLESITSTLQSQYSSRFIRLANPMALNATPEVLDLNIYAICSLWLSDALSENALDGDPVVDTEVASTFLGFAKLFLEWKGYYFIHVSKRKYDNPHYFIQYNSGNICSEWKRGLF